MPSHLRRTRQQSTVAIAFNKPYNVVCQFSPAESDDKEDLSDYLDFPNVYPAGRLDADSEGLLLLTDDGRLQHRITDPDSKQWKTYLAQVEGEITEDAIGMLRFGVEIKGEMTRPARARVVPEPEWLWPREPAIRERDSIPTSWVEIQIHEGRNRQVRHMTAAVGFPTLRLIRSAIGPVKLDDLAPGEWRELTEYELKSLWKQAPVRSNRLFRGSRGRR